MHVSIKLPLCLIKTTADYKNGKNPERSVKSGRLDSNQRPPRPERGALPTALRPDVQFNFRDFLQNWAIYIRY